MNSLIKILLFGVVWRYPRVTSVFQDLVIRLKIFNPLRHTRPIVHRPTSSGTNYKNYSKTISIRSERSNCILYRCRFDRRLDRVTGVLCPYTNLRFNRRCTSGPFSVFVTIIEPIPVSLVRESRRSTHLQSLFRREIYLYSFTFLRWTIDKFKISLSFFLYPPAPNRPYFLLFPSLSFLSFSVKTFCHINFFSFVWKGF